LKKAHRVALQSLQQLRAYTFNHSDEKNRRGDDEWHSQTKLLDQKENSGGGVVAKRRERASARASLRLEKSKKGRV
jgi:hypothetical protein